MFYFKSVIVDLYPWSDTIRLDISVRSLVTPEITFFRFSGSFYNLLLNSFFNLKLLNSGILLLLFYCRPFSFYFYTFSVESKNID